MPTLLERQIAALPEALTFLGFTETEAPTWERDDGQSLVLFSKPDTPGGNVLLLDDGVSLARRYDALTCWVTEGPFFDSLPQSAQLARDILALLPQE